MKKINLDESESEALANLAASGVNGYDVMKKIIQFYMRDLASILNVDPKGNIGLQTLARQHSYETISEIAETLFPEDAQAIRGARNLAGTETGDKKISPWR